MELTIDLGQFSSVVLALLTLGAIVKHAIPQIPSRWIPLGVLAGAIVGHVVLSGGWFDAQAWLSAIVSAASAVGLHSGIKHMREGKPDDPQGTLPLNGAVIVLLCSALVLSGCQTENAAGRLLASTVQTVDAAMSGWGTYVATGKATEADEAAVRQAYAKYQAAEALAERAYFASVQTGDGSAWQRARDELIASRNELLALLHTFNL